MSRPQLRILLGGVLTLLVGMQLLPLRVDNPPVRLEPAWDSPETRELAERACFDCHSNQTKVPLYGRVAPVSWYLRDHVLEGRSELNFSEMDQPQEEAHEAAEELMEGEMPPRSYLLMHPEARLSAQEKRALAAGLEATLGGDGGWEGGGDQDDDVDEGVDEG